MASTPFKIIESHQFLEQSEVHMQRAISVTNAHHFGVIAKYWSNYWFWQGVPPLKALIWVNH